MKISWGTGIFLFYTFFAGMMFFQVYQSTRYDHSLVADDYYAKDIAYQSMYEKQQHSLALANPVQFVYAQAEQQLTIEFPHEVGQPTGEVVFYRPQQGKDDLRIPLKTNPSGAMIIPLDQLAAGRWRVQVDWQTASSTYYDETIIDLPTIQ